MDSNKTYLIIWGEADFFDVEALCKSDTLEVVVSKKPQYVEALCKSDTLEVVVGKKPQYEMGRLLFEGSFEDARIVYEKIKDMREEEREQLRNLIWKLKKFFDNIGVLFFK